eukprot:jgi/Mesvir1/7941/Mv11861-RA.1
MASQRLTASSKELTLEQLMDVPGIAPLVMAALPVLDRVRLRRTCRTFLAGADESLLAVTELFGEELAGEGCTLSSTLRRSFTGGLDWLIRKCPKLTTISVASRADDEEPWQERDRLSLRWPWVKGCSIDTGILSSTMFAHDLPAITYLNLAGCLDVMDNVLYAIAGCCRRLEALDVSACRISNSSISSVARSNPGLLRLGISDCKRISDASLVFLSRHCPKLEVLYADGTRGTDAGFSAVARGCPRLRRLTVPAPVTDDGIIPVAERCPLLEHLGFLNFDGEVTDDSLKAIASNCPGFWRLDAVGREITDSGITALANGCPGLRRLVLSRTSVTGAGVTVIASHCAQLEHLDVGGCYDITDASIIMVARKCPRLWHLRVSGCSDVGDLSICQVALHCPGIRTLELDKTDITAASVEAIAARCHDLRRLDMAYCYGGKGLVAIADGCRKLEYLDITKPRCVTSEAVLAIGRQCTRLRVFKAGDIHVSEDTLVEFLQERGQGLRVLDLSGCSIPINVLNTVSTRCDTLRELVLRRCTDVKEHGLWRCMTRWKSLCVLDVAGCEMADAIARDVDQTRETHAQENAYFEVLRFHWPTIPLHGQD